MDTAYSLSDLASVMGNEGFGGNSAWLIILFVLIFGWGGFNGRNQQTESAIANNEILSGQKFDAISRQINSIGDGLSSLGYAQTNQISNEARAIQNQLSECCCTNQRNTDALRYDISQMFATSNANTTAQTQKILDALAQDKIASLQAEVSELKTQNMFCGIPRISNYAYGVYPYATNGCGCGMNNI